jgi:hypothetical protein
MTKSNRHRATYHQALLSRPTDHFDSIHGLLDTHDGDDDLLGQLLMEMRVQMRARNTGIDCRTRYGLCTSPKCVTAGAVRNDRKDSAA